MANKNATFKITCAYTGPSNEAALMPAMTIVAPYQAQMHGTVDVPSDTNTDVTFDIPFGGIESGTAVLVQNQTGQDLWLKWNSANIASHKQYLSNGGSALIAMPVLPGSFPITAVSFTTTDDQTDYGAGLVSFHIFGDPT